MVEAMVKDSVDAGQLVLHPFAELEVQVVGLACLCLSKSPYSVGLVWLH